MYNGKRRPRGDDKEQWILFFEKNPDKVEIYKEQWETHCENKEEQNAKQEKQKRRKTRKSRKEEVVETALTHKTFTSELPSLVDVKKTKKTQISYINVRIGDFFYAEKLNNLVQVIGITKDTLIFKLGTTNTLLEQPIEKIEELSLRNYQTFEELGINKSIKIPIKTLIKAEVF